MVKEKITLPSSTLVFFDETILSGALEPAAQSPVPLIWFQPPRARSRCEIVEADVLHQSPDESSPTGYTLEFRDPERVLVERNLSESDTHEKLDPLFLEHDFGLFYDFAFRPQSDYGVLDFANRFGTLGGSCQVPIFLNRRESTGERVSQWFREIEAMQRAIRVWELARAGNAAGIRKQIRVEILRHAGQIAMRVVTPADAIAAFDTFSSADSMRKSFADMMRLGPSETDVSEASDEQVLVASRRWLASQINSHICDGVTTMVSEQSGKVAGALRIVPQNLLAALWLQFSLAVCGQRKYRSCKTCGKPIALSPGGARKNRQHCSDACRSKAADDRRQRAIDLYELEGVRDIEQIALQVGSRPKTVQGWIRDHLADKNRTRS